MVPFAEQRHITGTVHSGQPCFAHRLCLWLVTKEAPWCRPFSRTSGWVLPVCQPDGVSCFPRNYPTFQPLTFHLRTVGLTPWGCDTSPYPLPPPKAYPFYTVPRIFLLYPSLKVLLLAYYSSTLSQLTFWVLKRIRKEKGAIPYDLIL